MVRDSSCFGIFGLWSFDALFVDGCFKAHGKVVWEIYPLVEVVSFFNGAAPPLNNS